MDRALKRMGETLRIRGYSRRTVEAYTCRARGFLIYTPYPVNQVNQEMVHRYLVHLKDDRNLSGSTINQTLFAIRFLFVHVLHRPWDIKRFRCHKLPRRLPVVLTREEIYDLFVAISNLKHRTILMTAYSAGLRLGEVTHLRIRDIDSKKMRILVRNGKGKKDRYVMLSRNLLKTLREYWKVCRPKDWLFPGQDLRQPISSTTVQKAFARAKRAAGIEKRAVPHSLRHSFAVHLLEIGTSLKYIKELLGHSSIQATLNYLKLAPECTQAVQSPLDQLPPISVPRTL